jgi:hypothetical protein
MCFLNYGILSVGHVHVGNWLFEKNIPTMEYFLKLWNTFLKQPNMFLKLRNIECWNIFVVSQTYI